MYDDLAFSELLPTDINEEKLTLRRGDTQSSKKIKPTYETMPIRIEHDSDSKLRDDTESVKIRVDKYRETFFKECGLQGLGFDISLLDIYSDEIEPFQAPDICPVTQENLQVAYNAYKEIILPGVPCYQFNSILKYGLHAAKLNSCIWSISTYSDETLLRLLEHAVNASLGFMSLNQSNHSKLYAKVSQWLTHRLIFDREILLNSEYITWFVLILYNMFLYYSTEDNIVAYDSILAYMEQAVSQNRDSLSPALLYHIYNIFVAIGKSQTDRQYWLCRINELYSIKGVSDVDVVTAKLTLLLGCLSTGDIYVKRTRYWHEDKQQLLKIADEIAKSSFIDSADTSDDIKSSVLILLNACKSEIFFSLNQTERAIKYLKRNLFRVNEIKRGSQALVIGMRKYFEMAIQIGQLDCLKRGAPIFNQFCQSFTAGYKYRNQRLIPLLESLRIPKFNFSESRDYFGEHNQNLHMLSLNDSGYKVDEIEHEGDETESSTCLSYMNTDYDASEKDLANMQLYIEDTVLLDHFL